MVRRAAFSLSMEREGTAVCLTLAGEFDAAAVARVERALAVAHERPLKRIVFDLSALSFLDLAGLRTILRAHRRAQAEGFGVTVVRPRGLANRVFTLTRAGDVLSMTDGR
jgi:anti-anti-sigma factor